MIPTPMGPLPNTHNNNSVTPSSSPAADDFQVVSRKKGEKENYITKVVVTKASRSTNSITSNNSNSSNKPKPQHKPPTSTKTSSSSKSSSKPTSPAHVNSKNRLFSYLLRNVNHAVDELYSQCEAENEEDFARDASKILKQCSTDFNELEKVSFCFAQGSSTLFTFIAQLIQFPIPISPFQRIRVQGEYIFLNADAAAKRRKNNQRNNRKNKSKTSIPPSPPPPTPNTFTSNMMASVSWDVRKSSTDKSKTHNSSVVRSSIERMERDAKAQRETNPMNFGDDDSSLEEAKIDLVHGTIPLDTENNLEDQFLDDQESDQPSPVSKLPTDNAWSKRLAFNAPNGQPARNSLAIRGKKLKIHDANADIDSVTAPLSPPRPKSSSNPNSNPNPNPPPVYVTQEAASVFPPAADSLTQFELGERLYTLLYPSQSDRAGKITGMLLELEVVELVHYLNNPEALNAKVAEAIQVLNEYEENIAATAAATPNDEPNNSADENIDPLSDNDNLDTSSDNETQRDIDKVWAEAEEWVDRISKAEEKAWKEFLNNDKNETKLSLEISSIIEDDDSPSLSPSLSQPKLSTTPRPASSSWYSSSEEEDEDERGLPRQQRLEPQKQRKQAAQSSAPHHNNHPPPRPFSTPSNQYTTHYSLHNKLSSPDRRRPSPAETKAKMDKRTAAAAMRRAEQEQEKQRKLAMAAEKIENARISLETKHQNFAASLEVKMRLAEEQVSGNGYCINGYIHYSLLLTHSTYFAPSSLGAGAGSKA